MQFMQIFQYIFNFNAESYCQYNFVQSWFEEEKKKLVVNQYFTFNIRTNKNFNYSTTITHTCSDYISV